MNNVTCRTTAEPAIKHYETKYRNAKSFLLFHNVLIKVKEGNYTGKKGQKMRLPPIFNLRRRDLSRWSRWHSGGVTRLRMSGKIDVIPNEREESQEAIPQLAFSGNQ
nr:hypothetical protein [uncultured Desulfobulbus sp.]